MIIFNGFQVFKRGIQSLLIFGLFLGSMQSFAFTTTITDTYKISEGETVIMAREKLLEKIKQKASRQAGSYISINKSIDQTNQLKETIDVISASLLKVDILNEKNKIVDGAIHLEITAKADVDESVLKARVIAVKDDSKKRQKIINLARQNEELLGKLEELSMALMKKDISSDEVTDLINSKNEIRREINENSASIEGAVSFNLDMAIDDARIQAEQKVLEKERKYKTKIRELRANAPEIDRKIVELVKSLYGADKLKSIDTQVEELHYFPKCNPGFQDYLLGSHNISRRKSTPEHLKEYLSSKYYKDANTQISPAYGLPRAYKRVNAKTADEGYAAMYGECSDVQILSFYDYFDAQVSSVVYVIEAAAEFEEASKEKYKELHHLLDTYGNDYQYSIEVTLLANVAPHNGKQYMEKEPKTIVFDKHKITDPKDCFINRLKGVKELPEHTAKNIDRFFTRFSIKRWEYSDEGSYDSRIGSTKIVFP